MKISRIDFKLSPALVAAGAIGVFAIAVGAQVQTADGSQAYTVQLDTTNVNYSPSLGGYTMNVGVGW